MELWTPAHLYSIPPALIVMIIVGVILRATIGDKPLKIRMIPFQILAVILLLLEIGKQVISMLRGYDLYHIPLHVCSLFIFMVPIMAFCREKHRGVASAITSALCTAVLLFMLVYPNLIYSGNDVKNFFTEYMSMHTVAFHNIVLFELVLIIALRLCTPDTKRDVPAVIYFTLGFCAAAGSMSQILKTNYANFYECNIPVFEQVRLSLQGVLGVGLTQLIYVLVLAVLHVLFVFMSYWLFRLLRRIFWGNPSGGELA